MIPPTRPKAPPPLTIGTTMKNKCIDIEEIEAILEYGKICKVIDDYGLEKEIFNEVDLKKWKKGVSVNKPL